MLGWNAFPGAFFGLFHPIFRPTLTHRGETQSLETLGFCLWSHSKKVAEHGYIFFDSSDARTSVYHRPQFLWKLFFKTAFSHQSQLDVSWSFGKQTVNIWTTSLWNLPNTGIWSPPRGQSVWGGEAGAVGPEFSFKSQLVALRMSLNVSHLKFFTCKIGLPVPIQDFQILNGNAKPSGGTE